MRAPSSSFVGRMRAPSSPATKLRPIAPVGRHAGHVDARALARELVVVPRGRAHLEPSGQAESLGVPVCGAACVWNDGVREAEAHVADGRVLEPIASRDGRQARTALDEREGHREVQLELVGDAVGPEEGTVDLVVDGVLVAASGTGRGHVQDDGARQVARDETEAELPGGDGLGGADGYEARRSGVGPEDVGVDAGAGDAGAVGGTRGGRQRERGQARQCGGGGESERPMGGEQGDATSHAHGRYHALPVTPCSKVEAGGAHRRRAPPRSRQRLAPATRDDCVARRAVRRRARRTSTSRRARARRRSAYLERVTAAKLDAVRAHDAGRGVRACSSPTRSSSRPMAASSASPADDSRGAGDDRASRRRDPRGQHALCARACREAGPRGPRPDRHARVTFRARRPRGGRGLRRDGRGQGQGRRIRGAGAGRGVHRAASRAATPCVVGFRCARSSWPCAACDGSERRARCVGVLAARRPEMRRRLDAPGVAAVALAARLVVVAWACGRFPAVEDGHYYDVLARRLAAGARVHVALARRRGHVRGALPGGLSRRCSRSAYALLGASGAAAMTVNALVGAAAAYAAHRLVDGEGVARWRPLAAGLAVALHPALVPYTAAVMTEGMTAALLVIAAGHGGPGARSRTRPWPWVGGAGVAMGVATLVRPQSLRAGAGARRAGGSRGDGGAPREARAWRRPVTARRAGLRRRRGRRATASRMHRCALVSVNGGWNLLIGAQTRTGAWEPIDVPPECATVWDEAGKDACFERARARDIAASPGGVARAGARQAGGRPSTTSARRPGTCTRATPAAFDETAKAGSRCGRDRGVPPPAAGALWRRWRAGRGRVRWRAGSWRSPERRPR